ncbi:PTS-dependent dihydroxyacetone kinase, ADP-binding subunit DhaL (Glycerone kinase) (DHA kinase) [Bradyrhizobium sp. ORS 285]|uniref:dihydroxyacetone kinase subunit DhaL n=1 Tax=Bradyrhizobium sp. ORS 285 TaxID=115808 RepID=UPI00024066F9|nr:dihydroxyacetone kinase subunit DhaL [Bradyrhizobium sp. ORS 285]CCD83721.1 PTS-dependent dihydroxyacetone kinase, ADP-binding subunit DhaL (Glycerone kinase) (DHA kinase) [Bradyrhizobium sp. ORS 285]SMX59267.1 PTS-dependent dihydroxyacetone kinase, ADP-binding subunit DhaL (Glycerone kinase) (DHA kinase) [Bradyrhizobium sp. ORS 285]
MDQAFKRRLIVAMADAIIAHAEELTELDSAIGDGDHGLNMKRGFEAVLADADNIAAKPLPDALKAVGMALVMKVGGASGPLYGTLAMGLGKALPAGPSAADAAAAFGRAIEDVKARGKSEAGQKTMLDVLIPVQAAFAVGGADLATRLPAIAAEAADATIPMKAIRGRASFLGERSIGHMDPGARSSSLLVQAICSVFNEA